MDILITGLLEYHPFKPLPKGLKCKGDNHQTMSEPWVLAWSLGADAACVLQLALKPTTRYLSPY
jgi:hypothetical protein